MTDDPCDGWRCRWPDYASRDHQPDRREPLTLETFEPRTATPPFAQFLIAIRTDWARYGYELDWTIEMDDGSSIELIVPYDFRFGTGPSWTSYGGEPSDPAEAETGMPYFYDEHGVRCEVCLTAAEQERVEAHIYENPPEPDYPDGDY